MSVMMNCAKLNSVFHNFTLKGSSSSSTVRPNEMYTKNEKEFPKSISRGTLLNIFLFKETTK